MHAILLACIFACVFCMQLRNINSCDIATDAAFSARNKHGPADRRGKFRSQNKTNDVTRHARSLQSRLRCAGAGGVVTVYYAHYVAQSNNLQKRREK